MAATWKSVSFTHHINNNINSYRHRQYRFCASIFHSAITWLIVPSLSPHNLQRGETLCLSTLLFILFVLSAWSFAAISIPSVSFFSNLVFSHFQLYWLLFSPVFLINCQCNVSSIKFFLLFRIYSSVFPSPRIPSLSAVFSCPSLLFCTYFFRLCFHFHTIFNTDHSSFTIVCSYVESVNISLRMECSVHCQFFHGLSVYWS